jgi:hypothetical protein
VIHKEIEEATSLEIPMLEKNMTIISSLVSLRYISWFIRDSYRYD